MICITFASNLHIIYITGAYGSTQPESGACAKGAALEEPVSNTVALPPKPINVNGKLSEYHFGFTLASIV